MHRFALDIDPVAYVRNIFSDQVPDPVHTLVLAELGGAESIVCYLRDDLKTVSERDVSLFRQIVKSYLNVRTNLTEENLKKLLTIKPDMITLVSPGDLKSVAPAPFNLELQTSLLQDYISRFRASNILTSVFIEPQMNQVKQAGKLEFDYIELDASALNSTEDMSGEMDLLEEIAGLVMAANKMGMGVNISGNIGFENMKELASIEFLEDIIVGKPVLNRALAIGFEQAVRDIISLI